MEFGRPTILVIQADGKSLLITPTMGLDMAEAAAVAFFDLKVFQNPMGSDFQALKQQSIDQIDDNPSLEPST